MDTYTCFGVLWSPCRSKRRYVLPDPDAKKPFRMMKAVKDEGMPTYKNPFVHGNLGLVKSGYG